MQGSFEFAGKFCGVGVAGRKKSVGLTGQEIDVEGADQGDQSLADCCVAAHEERVATGIGGDLSPFGDEGLERLGQLPGGGILDRHYLSARADRIRAGN